MHPEALVQSDSRPFQYAGHNMDADMDTGQAAENPSSVFHPAGIPIPLFSSIPHRHEKANRLMFPVQPGKPRFFSPFSLRKPGSDTARAGGRFLRIRSPPGQGLYFFPSFVQKTAAHYAGFLDGAHYTDRQIHPP